MCRRPPESTRPDTPVPYTTLLRRGAVAVCVVLGLDDRQPQVGLAIQDEVGAPRLAAAVELAADDHPTLGEADFFADLVLDVPASRLDSGGYELGADIPFR